ncbi:MAG: flagellar assembly protein FliH [Pseudomonadota bacterium]
MAKQKYRLQALLNIKQRLKKRAEALLAVAIKSLEKAKEKLDKLKEEKKEIVEKWEKARSDMKQKMADGAVVGKGNVHLNYLRKLKEDEAEKEEEIEDQKEVVKEAEDKVKSARREYIDACKELKVMSKHKELWQKKVKAEISRREEKEMDELGSTIHQIRKMRGEKSIGEI